MRPALPFTPLIRVGPKCWYVCCALAVALLHHSSAQGCGADAALLPFPSACGFDCSTRHTADAELSPQAATPLVIDGSKNPELFPEWFVWEKAFQSLARAGANPPIPLHVQLGITESELAFLQKELKLFEDSVGVLRKELKETRLALVAKGKSDDEVRNATRLHNLNYRNKILDARGRVHEELSPESLQRLRDWIDVRVKGTTVHLRGRAAEDFRLPW